MKYKAVVFDLDGTLLNSRQQITDKTLEAIKALKRMGCYVVVNTGRSYNACIYYSKLIDADYSISCNGAFTIDHKSGAFLNKLPLDKALTKEVLYMLYKTKDHLKIQWDSIKTYYSNSITDFEYAYLENYKKDYPDDVFNIKVVKDVEDLKAFDEEIYQIFFHPLHGAKGVYLKALEDLSKMEGINIVDFKSDYTDINHVSATKGKGLKKLADLLRIDSEEIVAFGDGENDISMFDYVGLAVAMENAPDHVKKCADVTTAENDKEGVLRVLETLFNLSPYRV